MLNWRNYSGVFAEELDDLDMSRTLH